MPLRRLFAASSVLFLLVLAISPAKNALRSYRSSSAIPQARLLARAQPEGGAGLRARPVAIQQIWLRDFDNRVDRCATCHLGVADPAHGRRAAAVRAASRHAAHAGGLRPLRLHVLPRRPGLATTQPDAHGTACGCRASDDASRLHRGGLRPLSPRESVPGAPVLSRGRALIARAGCYACHAVRGQDTFRSEAPPLATLPVKTGGEWLKRWLKDPKSIDPNATMPNFHLTDQAIDELSHFLFAAQVPKELAGQDRSRGGRAARQLRQRQEARLRSRAASPATPSRERETARRPSSPRSPPLRRAAGCSRSCASRRPSTRAPGCRAIASATPSRATSSLSWRTSSATSTPRRDPRAASREPEPRRERPQALPALRLLLLSRPRRIGVGEVRAGAGRHRRQAGAVARLRAPHRPRPHASDVARREARVAALVRRRAEDAFVRLQRRRLPRRRHGSPRSRRAARAGTLPVRAAAEAGAPARRAGRRPHPELPLPLLPPDRRPRRRRLDRRRSPTRGARSSASWLVGLPHALLHAAADPRGADARPENAAGRRDAARRRAAELLPRSVDPRRSVRRPSRVRRRPRRGPAALRGPRMPGLSHPGIVGRLLRAPVDRGRQEAQAGLDLRLAQGAAALEGGRPLPGLRPVRHGRAPPDRLSRDAPAGRASAKRGSAARGIK